MKEKFLKLSQIFLAVAAFAIMLGFGKTEALAASINQSAQTDTSITVTWTKPTIYRGNTLLSYYIGYSTDSNTARAMAENKSIPISANQNSYTINGLVPGTQYQVNIYYAYKSSGKTYLSSAGYAYVKTLPGQVTGINQDMWWRAIHQVDISWNKQTGVDGYKFTFMDEKGNVIESKTASYPSYGHKIDNKKIYKGVCQAYSTINGVTYWGPVSKTAYFMTQPAKKDVRELAGKVKGNKLTVSWEKVKGIDKYNVYVATSKGGAFKKVKTVKGNKTSATISKIGNKKIKGNKTYYVYVEGVKKINGETYTTGLLYITPISKRGASSVIYHTSDKW